MHAARLQHCACKKQEGLGNTAGLHKPSMPRCFRNSPACLAGTPPCPCSGHWAVPLQSAARIVQGLVLRLGAAWAEVRGSGRVRCAAATQRASQAGGAEEPMLPKFPAQVGPQPPPTCGARPPPPHTHASTLPLHFSTPMPVPQERAASALPGLLLPLPLAACMLVRVAGNLIQVSKACTLQAGMAGTAGQASTAQQAKRGAGRCVCPGCILAFGFAL